MKLITSMLNSGVKTPPPRLWFLLLKAALILWSSAALSAQTPVILSQPLSQTVPPGARVTFNVVASGTGQLHYQWKKDGLSVGNATTAALTIASATTLDAGDYSVEVSNDFGVTLSQVARLTVGTVQTPVITLQPVSQSVSAGASVTFSVSATGSAPLAYQWKKNGVELAGQTSATLSLNAVTSADAGNYSVVVSNGANAVASAVALLTVTVPNVPVILVQPVSQTVASGASVTFTVTATGASQLAYQWKKNGVDLAGKTSAALTLNAVTSADAGEYHVEVSNEAGVVVSQAANLAIGAGIAPTIVIQPAHSTTTVGGQAVFSVTANGSATLAYQWRKNGVNLAGQTSATLVLNNTTSADAGNYSVVVSNGAGTITSAVATLTVNPGASQPPVILTQPLSQTVAANGTAIFSVTASGLAQLNYQWKKNGADLPGQTNSTLTLVSVTATSAGNYSVEVSNSAGTTLSDVAVLTVGGVTGPAIVIQPLSQTVATGSQVLLSVTASGSATLTYQWRKDGVNLNGKTSSSLVLNNVTSADAGDYSVVVSNASGTIASATATLTVTATTQAPLIVLQPIARSVSAGASVSFTVNATGTGQLQYEWRKNGVALAGQTGATLTLNAVTSIDAGDYTVAISNASGTTISAPAHLTVETTGSAPVFTTQPANQSVAAGASATFSASVSGSGPFAFQWQKNGVLIVGATNVSLTLNNVTSAEAGSYTVTASNAAGATTSSAANLTVNGAGSPVITLQPLSQTVPAGATAIFSVTATGTGALSYQWTSNGVAIAGANQSTLALGRVEASSAANYQVIVSTTSGSTTSEIAVLTVTQTGLGSTDSSFAAAAISNVTTIATQADLKVIVAGGFTSVAGVPRSHLARLNADGSLDTAFRADLGGNGQVEKIVVQGDGKILLAGDFTSVGGGNRRGLARLNADGSLEAGFNAAAGANGTVHSVALQSNGKIVIGGDFTQINGQTSEFIGRLNADGSVDTSFTASGTPNTGVADLAVQTDDKIIIVGSFSTVQGTTRHGVARLAADGKIDASFGSSLNEGTSGPVTQVAIQGDGKILIAGAFVAVNGTTRIDLARLNADGTVDESFDAGLAAGASLGSIKLQGDGKILIGGHFNLSVGGLPKLVTRLNANGSLDASFDASSVVLEPVTDLAIQNDGKVLVASGSKLIRLLADVAFGTRILAIQLVQGGAGITVTTEAGKTYTLETQTSVNANAWVTVSTVAGDGSVKIMTDASATGAIRFYRVRVQ